MLILRLEMEYVRVKEQEGERLEGNLLSDEEEM